MQSSGRVPKARSGENTAISRDHPPPDPGQLPHEVDAARDVSAFGEAVGGVTAPEAALFSLLIKHRSACDQEENHSLRKCN